MPENESDTQCIPMMLIIMNIPPQLSPATVDHVKMEHSVRTEEAHTTAAVGRDLPDMTVKQVLVTLVSLLHCLVGSHLRVGTIHVIGYLARCVHVLGMFAMGYDQFLEKVGGGGFSLVKL